MILILIIGHTGNVFKKDFKQYLNTEFRLACVMFESKLILLIEFINFRRITFKQKIHNKISIQFF